MTFSCSLCVIRYPRVIRGDTGKKYSLWNEGLLYALGMNFNIK